MKQNNSCLAIRKYLFDQSLVCVLCVYIGGGASQNSFSDNKIVNCLEFKLYEMKCIVVVCI